LSVSDPGTAFVAAKVCINPQTAKFFRFFFSISETFSTFAANVWGEIQTSKH